MFWKIIGDIGQWTSLILSIIATVLGIVGNTPIPGWLLAIMGLLWGISTKIKYYGQRIVNMIQSNKRRVTLYEYNEIKQKRLRK